MYRHVMHVAPGDCSRCLAAAGEHRRCSMGGQQPGRSTVRPPDCEHQRHPRCHVRTARRDSGTCGFSSIPTNALHCVPCCWFLSSATLKALLISRVSRVWSVWACSVVPLCSDKGFHWARQATGLLPSAWTKWLFARAIQLPNLYFLWLTGM